MLTNWKIFAKNLVNKLDFMFAPLGEIDGFTLSCHKREF